MPATQQPAAQVFISYSHKDREWLDRLNVHLAPVKCSYSVVIWDDTTLNPGMQWDAEIKKALSSVQAAILLLSADFLASEYINNQELPTLLEATASKGATILSIIVSPCLLSSVPKLAAIQTVNTPKSPLVNLKGGKREEIFVKIAEQLINLLNQAPVAVPMNGPVKNLATRPGKKSSIKEISKQVVTALDKQRNNEVVNPSVKTIAPRPAIKSMGKQIVQQLQLLNDNPNRFLRVSAGEVYVQYLNYADTDDVLFEVVSNAFLPKEDKLSASQVDDLLAIGFDKPAKNFPNYTMGCELLNKRSIPTLAALTADNLCNVYGLPEEATLSFEHGSASYQ